MTQLKDAEDRKQKKKNLKKTVMLLWGCPSSLEKRHLVNEILDLDFKLSATIHPSGLYGMHKVLGQVAVLSVLSGTGAREIYW